MDYCYLRREETVQVTLSLRITTIIVVGMLVLLLNYGDLSTADIYTDSAHGNISYGVKRSGTGKNIGVFIIDRKV